MSGLFTSPCQLFLYITVGAFSWGQSASQVARYRLTEQPVFYGKSRIHHLPQAHVGKYSSNSSATSQHD